MARSLTEAGITVYLIHYFNRTRSVFALDAGMQKNFPAWLETARDAIAWVQKQPGGSRPLGIYGYSLGGFLALAAASDNPGVGAVVAHAGGIWNGTEERFGRMPAVLVAHGELDNRVPFRKYAPPLVRLLRERGGKVETAFFAGESHVFTPAGMKQVQEGAARFFQRHLGFEPGSRSENGDEPGSRLNFATGALRLPSRIAPAPCSKIL